MIQRIGPHHLQKESLKAGTARYQESLVLKTGASLRRQEMENRSSKGTQVQLPSCLEGTPCPRNQATLDGAPTNRYSTLSDKKQTSLNYCLKTSKSHAVVIYPGEVKPHGAEVRSQPPEVPICQQRPKLQVDKVKIQKRCKAGRQPENQRFPKDPEE